MVCPPPTPQPMPNLAKPPPLTNLLSSQILELRARGPVDIMILAGKAVLARVRERIVLIAPMAGVVEPVDGGAGGAGGSAQDMGGAVVDERVRVLRRVPERAAVRLVVQEAPGEHVGMYARRGVHGVRACGAVHDGALGAACGGWRSTRCRAWCRCRLARGGTFRPRGRRRLRRSCARIGRRILGGVDEADDGVLPVTDVVAEADVQDFVA
ncbi:hypothetical protein L1887_63312 [Cichorium endivia]|nr:hypothetical protein L1887_63312 [Cichorium endivia]